MMKLEKVSVIALVVSAHVISFFFFISWYWAACETQVLAIWKRIIKKNVELPVFGFSHLIFTVYGY